MQTLVTRPDERRLNRRKEAIRRATSSTNCRVANAEKEAQSLRFVEACRVPGKKCSQKIDRRTLSVFFNCLWIINENS